MEKGISRRRIPVVEWFTMDPDQPHLIGNRCTSCGDYFFPKAFRCKNPACAGEELEEIQLGRKGKLWSYTVTYYQPPPPYVPLDPFEPYALAIVELDIEKMMILGQVTAECDLEKLKIGMEMELIVEKLHLDDQGNEHVIWKWRPVFE